MAAKTIPADHIPADLLRVIGHNPSRVNGDTNARRILRALQNACSPSTLIKMGQVGEDLVWSTSCVNPEDATGNVIHGIMDDATQKVLAWLRSNGWINAKRNDRGIIEVRVIGDRYSALDRAGYAADVHFAS